VARAVAAAEVPAPPSRWLRPGAWASGALGVLLGGLAVHQGLAARSAYSDADAMLLPGGILRPGVDPATHAAALRRGDVATRNAWLAGGTAVVSAAASGLLFWWSREP
jgi:hypothetical protein